MLIDHILTMLCSFSRTQYWNFSEPWYIDLFFSTPPSDDLLNIYIISCITKLQNIISLVNWRLNHAENYCLSEKHLPRLWNLEQRSYCRSQVSYFHRDNIILWILILEVCKGKNKILEWGWDGWNRKQLPSLREFIIRSCSG